MKLVTDVAGRGGAVFVDGLPGERTEHAAERNLQVRVIAVLMLLDRTTEPRKVLLVCGFPGLLVTECRISRGHLGQSLEDETCLNGERLLCPQRTVVIEDGDALLGWNFARYHFDECR